MLQKRNIRVLFAMSFLQGLVFYASIATLYRRAAGVSLFEMAVIESVSLLLSLALEVPWGVVADRIGYRRTSILCSLVLFVSKIVFWKASGYGGFLLERILLAIAVAGSSGVDESILVASCPQEQTHRAFGWLSTLGTTGLLCASFVYSVFVGDDYRLAALLTVVSYALSALLPFFLEETHIVQSQEHFPRLRALFRDLFSTRGLIPLVISGALFGECVQMITVFLNQLQYERCALPARQIGMVHMAGTVIMLCSAASARFAKRLGERRMGLVLIGTGAVLCMLLAFTQSAWASIVCILLLCFCGALFTPLLSAGTNRLIKEENRATALSLMAIFSNSTAVTIEMLVGRVADWTLPGAMLVCAGLCVGALELFARSRAS